MTPQIAVIFVYILALTWVLVRGNSVGTQVLVVVVLLVQIAAAIAYATEFYRHQKLLEWFKNHVRLERSRLPDDAPEDLVGKEDDDDDD